MTTATYDIDWDLYGKVYDFVFGEGQDARIKRFLTKKESAEVREAVKLIATHNETITAISDRAVGTLSEEEMTSVNRALTIMAKQVDVIHEIFEKGRTRIN